MQFSEPVFKFNKVYFWPIVPYAWAGYNKQQLPFVQHVPKNIIHDLRNCQHAASTLKYESAQLSNGLLNKRLNNIRHN